MANPARIYRLYLLAQQPLVSHIPLTLFETIEVVSSNQYQDNVKMSQLSSNPIPFSEPPYLCGLPSPYYSPGHRRFQKACREFFWEHLHSHAAEYEKAGQVPEHVFHTFCKHNMLLPNIGAPLPVEWLKRLGIADILGVKVEDWDYMYTGIYFDEVGIPGERQGTTDSFRWHDPVWLGRVHP